MKLLLGSVAAAGVLIAATAADAQVLPPYRIGGPAVIVSDISSAATGAWTAVTDFGARILPPYRSSGSTVVVSDMEGPYAEYVPGPPRYAPPVLAPRDIDAIARDRGFSPLGAPQQRGFVYTMSAVNLDGEDGRLVIDARDGRILRFMPAYRMGDRMGEEVVTTYGPVGPPPPDYRRAPRPPASLPKVASRTPNVPLPKATPPRAMATPAKPVAVAPIAHPPVAAAPTATPAAAPVQQSAVAEPKPAEAAPPPPAAAAADTAAPAAPVEAKSSSPVQPTQPMPAVQGLE